jgi:peptide subunit release factor 1 (eRF1)
VNVACRCTKCGKTFLFTAEEQKIAFEINKEYISKPKHRCNECQLELEVIQNRERNLQLAWNENSKVLRADREFLNEWITILELIPTFRKKKNCSTITMLRKALHDCI